MRRRYSIAVLLAVAGLAVLTGGCGKKEDHGLSKQNPVTITVWHYYNGMQKEKFDSLVQQFNETEGKEKGIIIDPHTKGSVDELSQALTDSSQKKVGSEPLPEMAAVYADKAYELYREDLVADISQYMTGEERDQYVKAYMDEGNFAGEGSMLLFPIAKSTEVFAINKTDWDKFQAATGASDASFATWEGITKVAEEYYEWTDSLTETENDGKAFFGRDAFANYMIIGSLQLGHEIFTTENGKTTLDFDRDTMKKLWDHYYVPVINGYFGEYGKFRSDDVKTGQLAAFVGSTSGMAYFPRAVTLEDGTSYEIENAVYPLPDFENTSPCAVQQGAGMMLVKSGETKEYASTLFLKWFTGVDNNIDFSLASGYLPVKKDSDMKSRIEKALEDSGSGLLASSRSLTVGLTIANEYRLYTTRPFQDSESARRLLNSTMADIAKHDRAQVEQLMGEGMTREDAVARFDTEENFNTWYEETKAALQAIVGE